MTDTVYRFLPWSRRGLSAALPGAADAAPLPARAEVAIEVVVGGAGTVATGTTLHGPGDVIGLDPTVIVRTVPRPQATNVEPNYLASVDFDQPELPWLFTPTGVPASGHLRPWLVLVVVEDRPGVSLTLPTGAMLPHLSISSGAARELPDLAESWAWAHAQLLDQDGGTTPQAVGQALSDRPDHNVSRLVCPRRLEPDKRWLACLVPAYDAGVVRGFGGTPASPTLAPAWESPDAIELPVYYHWEFQTGPQGDFESLARRLAPYEAAARLGQVKMHVGASTPFLDPITDDRRFLDMDGALRAPGVARTSAVPPVPDPALTDVADGLRTGLQDVTRLLADAADGTIDGQTVGDTDALGPPVYAGRHVQRTSVTDADQTWFQELNTDPRCRVAAGLGAEVMRKYQEDVVRACWEQVGDVVALELALSRARLGLELGLRFTARHLAPLPPGRFAQVTAPVAGRTLLGVTTIPHAIAPTSLPDRATDAAMRRLTGARSRVVSGIARRATTPTVAPAARSAGERLLTTLAAGRPDVDATRFPVVAVDGLSTGLPAADGAGNVSLDGLGAAVVLDKVSAALLTRSTRDLTSTAVPVARDAINARSDLIRTGLVSQDQLEVARELSVQQLDATRELNAGSVTVSQVADASPSAVLDAVSAAVSLAAQPTVGDAGFLLETGPEIVVRPLGLGSGGQVVVLNDRGPNVTIATVDRGLSGSASEVGAVLARLPVGTLAPMTVRRGGVLESTSVVAVRGGAGPGTLLTSTPDRRVDEPGRTTSTLPPFIRDAATLDRYQTAVVELGRRTPLGTDPVRAELVAFDLADAVDAVRVRTDPTLVHPARLGSMVSIHGHGLADLLVDPDLVPAWRFPPLADRVMAFPRLEVPAYTYLAEYDRTRFCPGVDEVPPDSITLLETNPRFIAGFMGGLNHETNGELLWRGYPTDGRGTPWQRFWQRVDGAPDVYEMHTWGTRGGRDDLPAQTTDSDGSLVLLIRGDLLRRYPRTMVVAVPAASPSMPSDDTALVRTPIFAGRFDPDVSFFGFDLAGTDLTSGAGWFFGLLEPVTEPRFGFDETVGRETPTPTSWNDVAWADLGVPPSGLLPLRALSGLGLTPSPGQADGVAAALFQRPFKLMVHARHLVKGI